MQPLWYENMVILYFAALAAIIALIVLYMVHHLRAGGGCCGSHEAPAKRIRAADRNPSHYPYHYTAQIEGMVCGNCARRVENLFNESGDCFASVNLAERCAEIYTKRKTERTECAKKLEHIGYTLIEWEEHHKPE